jgi:hypothetical protein
MFVSVELASRIERAESRLSAAFAKAVNPRDPQSQSDSFVEEIAGGVAVYTGSVSPVNKMIGVGFAGLPGDDQLRAIEEKFARRGAALQIELSTLADPAFAASLSGRGYVLQGFENVLGRRITPEDAKPPANPVIEIALMKGDADRWVEVAVTGFLNPDVQGVQPEALPPREVMERAFKDSARVSGFLSYTARIGGELVGVAAMRLQDGIAQFCGATTLPAYRRRGVQNALLRRRLADAFHADCDLAIITTAPGSKSQQNADKNGFVLLYSRALLIKPPP